MPTLGGFELTYRRAKSFAEHVHWNRESAEDQVENGQISVDLDRSDLGEPRWHILAGKEDEDGLEQTCGDKSLGGGSSMDIENVRDAC